MKKLLALTLAAIMMMSMASAEGLLGGLFGTVKNDAIPAQLQEAEFVSKFGMPEVMEEDGMIMLAYLEIDMTEFATFVGMLKPDDLMGIVYDPVNQMLILLYGDEFQIQVMDTDDVSAPAPAPTPAPTPTPSVHRDCPDCTLGVCNSCGYGEDPCERCYGSGECSVCWGSGYKTNYRGDEVKCTSCNYGVCRSCKGLGWVDCPKCDGGECNRCGGDGEL